MITMKESTKAIMVSNAKGGTGKTLMSYNIARKLSENNDVALIDADIDSSNFSQIAGVGDKIGITESDKFELYDYNSIKVFSMSLLADKKTGVSMTGDRYTQILSDVVDYSELDVDYIVVDMPAGSSDIFKAITLLFQDILIGGLIIVQPAAINDSYRTISLYNQNSIPILGLIENMSGFECPNCEKKYDIFGKSHLDELHETFGVEVMGKVPLSQEIRKNVENQEPLIPEDINKPIETAVSIIEKTDIPHRTFVEKAKSKVSNIAKDKLEGVLAKLINKTNRNINLSKIQNEYSFKKEQILDFVITNRDGDKVISRTHMILKDGKLKVFNKAIEANKQVVTDFQTLARIIYGKRKVKDGTVDYDLWTAYLQSDLKVYGRGSTPEITRIFRTVFNDEEVMNEIKKSYGKVLKKFI